MSADLRSRLLRRLLVLGMTVAVVAVGIASVRVAAAWRAEAAPLDTEPVAMSQVEADLGAETVRSTELADQIYEVAGQVAVLRGALLTANDTVTGDHESAARLEARLAKATARLERLQDQLKTAQKRLRQLNDAAARQAALNRAAATSSSGSGGASRDDDHEDEEHEDEDHEEHNDD
jgi:TolA-binding protein